MSYEPRMIWHLFNSPINRSNSKSSRAVEDIRLKLWHFPSHISTHDECIIFPWGTWHFRRGLKIENLSAIKRATSIFYARPLLFAQIQLWRFLHDKSLLTQQTKTSKLNTSKNGGFVNLEKIAFLHAWFFNIYVWVFPFYCVLFALDFERFCVEIVVLIFEKIGQKVVEPVPQCAFAI